MGEAADDEGAPLSPGAARRAHQAWVQITPRRQRREPKVPVMWSRDPWNRMSASRRRAWRERYPDSPWYFALAGKRFYYGMAHPQFVPDKTFLDILPDEALFPPHLRLWKDARGGRHVPECSCGRASCPCRE